MPRVCWKLVGVTMSWSLCHLPLESPIWKGLLTKGDQVLGDVHLENVLPGPPQDGLEPPAWVGEHSQVLLLQVSQKGLILQLLHLIRP